MTPEPTTLPIHAIRASFERAFAEGPVVVSSPTGSGKSTEIPRWLASLGARVLVVEPRRVACRSLATRVAELEGTTVGASVGYVVRDDACHGDATRILFATPGIVLRSRSLLRSYDVVVLDELHERSLDLDLLLALFARHRDSPRTVVMSATIEGDRIARHLGATHVTSEGRTFPVDLRYLGSRSGLPDADELASRVAAAVDRARDDQGDLLVFLPGKAEIDACARAFSSARFEVVRLHGGLPAAEQRRAFLPAERRKLVLATNVAETSITLPGIGVVIDSGLVRRSRYHDGRSFLALAPIAEDSATQRAGRAGRTGPGIAYRLWSREARLSPSTPPEIHRESLVPLVMNAAAWDADVDALPFLDAPRPYALEAARDELRALGALAEGRRLSERGRELFDLPLDPKLARLLVEARERGTLDDAIELVAALSVGRPLIVDPSLDGVRVKEHDCDASVLVRAMRRGEAGDPGLAASVLDEARRTRARLRRLFALPTEPPTRELDRGALVATALAADPRSGFVTRVRGRRIAFANGGTELELARDSVLGHARTPPEAIVVFESRAFGAGAEARIVVTAASPLSLDALARAGLGSERIAHVALERGRVVTTIERVYAERVLATREDVPHGPLARDAIATLYLRGSLFRDAMRASEERLALGALAARLGPEQLGETLPSVPDLAGFVAERLAALGVESGDDLALLSPSDLLAPDVPFHVRSVLERDHPRTVNVGDAVYRASFDLDARRVTLVPIRGQRKDAPPLSYLPKYPGFSIAVETPRGLQLLRGRA